MTRKEAYFVFQSYWSDVPMVRLYGHSWPIRWGEAGEQKMVKVYSNCGTAELFVNGKSAGVRHRNSQDFPAAGLRWMTPFLAGKNTLRVVATRGKTTVTDQISFIYQTDTWDKAAELKLMEKSRTAETVTVEAKVYDSKGVLCPRRTQSGAFQHCRSRKAARQQGNLSRLARGELCNGRAEITLLRNDGGSVVGVATAGLPTAFCTIP